MTRGAVLAPAAMALALCAAGCLTATNQTRLQKDMADVRQQSFDTQKSMAEIKTRLDSIEEALKSSAGASPTRFADLETLLQSLSDQVRALGARLDDNTSRMSTLAQEIALARQQYRALDARLAAALATRGLPAPSASPMPGGEPGTEGGEPGAPAPGTPPAGSEGTPGGSQPPGQATGGTGATPAGVAPGAGGAPAPAGTDANSAAASKLSPDEMGAAQESAFRAAYSDYTRGSYESALMGFQEFLKSYPDSPLAEGAQYYVGDCLFSQQKYQEASDAFTKVIENYPESDKAPSAHLKKGLSLLALKQTARGVIQLQHVIETYPRSEEARLARERLRQLGLSVH